uniref:Uncharacterized protein n=1 Tax=Polynucleobacter necessarius subsp. necessarius (strain STIR1) TaxID=452638 RepID=B1XRU9_POLNS
MTPIIRQAVFDRQASGFSSQGRIKMGGWIIFPGKSIF